MRWSPWIAVFAGFWLVAAPFAAGYNTLSDVATTEAIVLGVLMLFRRR